MARAIRVRIYYTKAGVASCVRTSPRSLKSFYILAARVVYIVHNGLSLLLRGRATSMTTMLAFLVLGYACAMASCAHSPQQTLPHFFGVILSRWTKETTPTALRVDILFLGYKNVLGRENCWFFFFFFLRKIEMMSFVFKNFFNYFSKGFQNSFFFISVSTTLRKIK